MAGSLFFLGSNTWRVVEYATLKFATYTEGLFWAKGNWEKTNIEKLSVPHLPKSIY